MGKDQWVSPRGDKWAVHGAGNERDTKLFDTQKQAQDYAIKIAKDSYGNDPCPPRDTEH